MAERAGGRTDASARVRRSGARAAAARSRRHACAAIALGAALLLGGCATGGDELHLAPVWSRWSAVGGGVESEALGGMVRVRRPEPGGPVVHESVRPFLMTDQISDEVTLTRFLVPFGRSYSGPDEHVWQLLPLTRYQRANLRNGQLEWTFFQFPGIYVARKADGRILRGWFPFGGVFERFLFYDRLEFVLWPIYTKSVHGERVGYNILWPFFGYKYGTGGTSVRIWPLYGRNRKEGSYDRTFLLWPFFHWSTDKIRLPGEAPQKKWMFWPFLGRSHRGSYRSTSVLWPFFGLARNPETGFWAWDGPWPLVRVQRGGRGNYERTRFWPFYGYYRGDGLISKSFLWPIIGQRHEEYSTFEKTVEYAWPLWQHHRVHRPAEGDSTWEKLWPFYQLERRREDTRKFMIPQLNPLWRTPTIDDAYGWLWTVYAEQRSPEQRRQRGWFGIWRRETDETEDRSSLVGLWSRRRYVDRGERVSEHAVLFGLIRWRSRPSNGLEWMRPALPGPGWPIERSKTPFPSVQEASPEEAPSDG